MTTAKKEPDKGVERMEKDRAAIIIMANSEDAIKWKNISNNNEDHNESDIFKAILKTFEEHQNEGREPERRTNQDSREKDYQRIAGLSNKNGLGKPRWLQLWEGLEREAKSRKGAK